MRCWTVAVLLCFSVFLAGCGGSDGTTTAGAGAPPPPGSGPPPPPGEGGEGSGTPMEGSEGNPDGTQPPASDSGEPMPPADAAPQSDTPGAESPDGAQPTSDPNADPNQPVELNPDGTPVEPARPKTLREQAIAAFAEGNDAEGRRLLQSHFIAVPDAKAELAKKMAWFPGLARPALGPRVGFAVLYSESSRDFRGNPMPIGSAELATAIEQMQQNTGGDQGSGRRSRNRGGGEPAGGGAAASGSGAPSSVDPDNVGSAGAKEQLRFYTGEFGEILLETLQEQFDGGQYGAVPKELLEETARERRQADDPNNPEAAPDVSDASASAGQSEAPAGGSARARRRTGRSSAAAATDTASLAEHIKQLAPGILWLGKCDEREQVIKRAEAAHVDLLAIFEITAREARGGGMVNNTTRLRLLSMKQGNPAVADHKPEPLVNLTVEQWRVKELKGTDPVDREITKAVEALDKVLKPAPLPEALTAERAKKRVADLVAQKPEDPLPVLVEARFYVAKKLLPETDFEAAAVALLGDSGYAELKEKAKVGTE